MRFRGCFVGLFIVFLHVVGVANAFTPHEAKNRPAPLMDYVPQELGIYDGLYDSLAEADCRICHGASLADRHHLSEIALNNPGACTPCHEVIQEDPGVLVRHNCTVVGCHSAAYNLGSRDANNLPDSDPTADPFTPGVSEPNGWHHSTNLSFVKQCVACHDPAVVDRVTDIADLTPPPPSLVSPSPFDCENCHWEQPVIANSIGWTYGDSPDPTMLEAGHPSTYDHNAPYEPYNMYGSLTPGVSGDEYFEYGIKIESNFDTHHMKWRGNVYPDCVQCHSMDSCQPSWDGTNSELIRYCRTCHDVRSLHIIEPHVGPGGTGDPPAVNGWEAVGFHTLDGSGDLITSTTDVAPEVYRNYSTNEQCFGCHGTSLPDYLPETPPAGPEITDMSPNIGACDGYYTLTGNYFGSDKTVDRWVEMTPTLGGTWEQLPILSWTSTQIEFQVPCWIYAEGNYGVRVHTEVGNSNYEVLKLKSQASVTSISPTSGPCREIITVNGNDFDNFGVGRDGVNAEGYGEAKVVVFSASVGQFTATVYANWTDTSFLVRFGDLFEDLDGDYVRDSNEPLLKQCEDTPLGQYSMYVRTIYYEDGDASGNYSDGDIVHQMATSDPEYFTMAEEPVLYALYPEQIERSHYCGSDVVNSIVKIYGWGFGPEQGDGKVYIGTGGMYYSDSGLELTRTAWTSLLIKAAVDVPGGAKGMTLYIWVEKNGQKTDASYGYPGIEILTSETCP